uniref:Uncharacterized protein n=1 Tax=Micrurus spixii TaxID=129469 RepID=A0A2D4ML02_9SAUR
MGSFFEIYSSYKGGSCSCSLLGSLVGCLVGAGVPLHLLTFPILMPDIVSYGEVCRTHSMAIGLVAAPFQHLTNAVTLPLAAATTLSHLGHIAGLFLLLENYFCVSKVLSTIIKNMA